MMPNIFLTDIKMIKNLHLRMLKAAEEGGADVISSMRYKRRTLPNEVFDIVSELKKY